MPHDALPKVFLATVAAPVGFDEGAFVFVTEEVLRLTLLVGLTSLTAR